MALKFSNFGKAIVASAPSGTTGLSFTVEAGKGLFFPAMAGGDYFYGTFKSATGNREIVKVTARSTDSMTIAAGGRGMDGTTARTWAAGDYFVAGITNVAISEVMGNANINAIGNLTSTANTIPYFTGSGTAGITSLTSFARTLIDDASATTMLTTLGLSAFAKTLVDDTNAASARTTLGALSKVGTTTDNSAAAGEVGEVVSSTIPPGSAVSITSNVQKNVTSIILTPGDWDVHGCVLYTPGSTTRITSIQGSISTTSGIIDDTARFVVVDTNGWVPGSRIGHAVPEQRISISSTLTVYLVGYASFTVSGISAYGRIWGRRACTQS